MPITRKLEPSFYDSAGVRHATNQDAQRAELLRILQPSVGHNGFENVGESAVQAVLENATDIVSILTTGPRSRPKARKAPGTTAPKRAARQRVPAEVAQPAFKAMHEAAEAAHAQPA